MWGWKSIERSVSTSAGLDSARAVLSEKGYQISEETDGALFVKKPGTQFTMKGQEMPVEIAVAAESNGLFLQARYASFVLFDTGDLESHLNDIVDDIEQAVG